MLACVLYLYDTHVLQLAAGPCWLLPETAIHTTDGTLIPDEISNARQATHSHPVAAAVGWAEHTSADVLSQVSVAMEMMESCAWRYRQKISTLRGLMLQLECIQTHVGSSAG